MKDKLHTCFLSRYERLGASSRYRFFQYIPYLQKLGIDVSVSSLYSNEYLISKYQGRSVTLHMLRALIGRTMFVLRSRKRFQLLVLEYELFPYFPRLFEFIALKWLATPYIVEFDDAVYTRYQGVLGGLYKGKMPSLLSGAELVIAGNPYLQEKLTELGAIKTAIIPTTVDTAKYVPVEKKDDQLCRIVWMGSPSTAPYLEELTKVFEKILSENVVLVVIGGGAWRLGGNAFTEYRDWNEESEAKDLSACDIGIMPLVDDEWAKGKCGLKLIQYMAAGLAVVASPVGVNSEIVDAGENGFLAASQEDWFESLGQLISDKHLRDKFGQRGKSKAEQCYSITANVTRIVKLYREAAGV